jgi:H+-transporting ATPase
VCVCVHVWAISIVWYFPQDPIKFIARYTLSGRAWTLLTERKVFFTRKRNFGRDIRQAQWASDSGSVLHAAKTKSRTYVQGNNNIRIITFPSSETNQFLKIKIDITQY